MRFLRLLTFAGPFLVKGTSKRQRRKYALLSGAYLLLLVSAILFCIAAFIRISSIYGADIACLSLCAFFTLVAIGCILSTRSNVSHSEPATRESNDPLASYLPKALSEDPSIVELIKLIEKHPLIATSSAATLGAVMAGEFFGDKHE